MKPPVLLAGCLLAGAALLAAGAAHAVSPLNEGRTNTGKSVRTAAPVRVSAEENFRWYCIQCHGPNGDGKGVNNTDKLPVSPRNLTNGKDMSQFSDRDMRRTITHGGAASELSPIMPPWGNVFTKKEILDLVGLVRKLCKCKFDPKARAAFRKEQGLPPEPRK